MTARGAQLRERRPDPEMWEPRTFDHDAFIAIIEANVDQVVSPEHMLSQQITLVSNSCDAALKRVLRGNRLAPLSDETNRL